MHILNVALPVLVLAAPPSKPFTTQPSSWANYFSGGPARAGDSLDVPGFGKGVVVGDFNQIPRGDASENRGRNFYLVMVPKGASDPDFGLDVLMVELDAR